MQKNIHANVQNLKSLQHNTTTAEQEHNTTGTDKQKKEKKMQKGVVNKESECKTK